MSYKIPNLKRLTDIIQILTKYGFGSFLKQMGLAKFSLKKKKISELSNGERLRMALSELGPTFVKFGQLLSTHEDIIPKDIIVELKKLQDHVPPIEYSEVKKVIFEEFGSSVDKIYKSFDKHALASASIGQVHEAVLKDGTKVVVKIQRPGLMEVIKNDIGLMLVLGELMEKYLPEMKLYSPIGLIKEFEKSILKELDFALEAQNLSRFKEYFQFDDSAYFPQLYPLFSSKRVITMEKIEGIKVNELKEHIHDKKRLAKIAKNGADCIFKQIFDLGFFHADPHSGNIIITKHDKVCFIDFGMVGHLDEDSKEFLAGSLIAVINKDIDALMLCLVRYGVLPLNNDLSGLKSDIYDLFEKYYGIDLQNLDLRFLLNNVTQIIAERKIKIPTNLMMVIRCLITVEGVGKEIYPEFTPVKELEPFIAKLSVKKFLPSNIFDDLKSVLTGVVPLIKPLLMDSISFTRYLAKGEPIRVENTQLNAIADRLRKDLRFVAYAIVLGCSIIALAIFLK